MDAHRPLPPHRKIAAVASLMRLFALLPVSPVGSRLRGQGGDGDRVGSRFRGNDVAPGGCMGRRARRPVVALSRRLDSRLRGNDGNEMGFRLRGQGGEASVAPARQSSAEGRGAPRPVPFDPRRHVIPAKAGTYWPVPRCESGNLLAAPRCVGGNLLGPSPPATSAPCALAPPLPMLQARRYTAPR